MEPSYLPSPRPLSLPLQVRGKAMADKAVDMLDIVRDILLTARLDNKERFKQVGVWPGGRVGWVPVGGGAGGECVSG